VWMQILHLLGADLYWVALVALAAAVAWPQQTSNTLHTAN
jgi:cytochrome c oxidase assembly protein subunit 15